MDDSESAVRMDGVSVRREIEILREIDWTVGPGQSCAVLGPNGCGKSTLVNVITGRMWPTTGTAYVLGRQLGTVDMRQLRRKIAVVNPAARLNIDERLSARQVVLSGFFATLFLYDQPDEQQHERAEHLLDVVGLSQRKDQRFALLSTGERRRCMLARALVRVPELLILDEPTDGLDILGRERLLATLDRLHRQHPLLTVITVSHHVEELSPRTDQVLLLKAGEVFDSGPPEKTLSSAGLSQVYGCQVNVTRRGGRWWLDVPADSWADLVDP